VYLYATSCGDDNICGEHVQLYIYGLDRRGFMWLRGKDAPMGLCSY
jgi:hypothetical protein